MQSCARMTHARLRPGIVVRIRRQQWRVVQMSTHARAARLEVAGTESANRGTRATFLLPAERVDPANADTRPRAVSAARWRRVARGVLGHGLARFDSVRTAAAARISLIPFQLEPALAVTRGLGSRILIADEVGLGKTIQAGLVGAEILSRHPDARILVVTPAGLREQWAMELHARFALRAAVLDGRTLAAMGDAPHLNPWAAHPVVVTSIDFVKRPEVLRGLDSLVWDLAVFDEAHALCGSSERASAAEGLARRSRSVVLLSATPHSGDETAFARLCRIGSLGRDPLLVFHRTRLEAGLGVGRRTLRLRVRPNAAEVAMQRALQAYARRVWHDPTAGAASRLTMTVLLKRACSSATALLHSLERRLRLLAAPEPATGAQMPLPFADADDDAEPASVLGARGLADREDECRRVESLIELAREAARSESKLAALRRLLRRVRQPAVVFTEYRDTLALLVATIPVSSVQIHGGLTASERRDAVRAFTDGDAGVLFATDAASEGLNLQRRCRLVVTLELPWSPVRLEQRVGRIDRIGQHARVHAVQLLAADTPEEAVVSRLLERQSRASSWFTAPGAATDEAVAAAIVSGTATGARPDGPARGGSEAHDLVFPDLRIEAAQEAQRLATCRALLAGVPEDVASRPIVALVRSGRRARTSRTCVCAQVPFVDRTERVHWQTVVGAAITHEQPGSIALATGPLWSRLTPDVTALVEARTSAITWARRSMTRERALVEGLLERRGRLAAFQGGLFDRRAERRTAIQSAELEAALARCHERIQLLEALLEAVPGPREPIFTVVLR